MIRYIVFISTILINILFSQPTNKYKDIFFLNYNNGWIQTNDNFIYITRDGGESWIKKQSPQGNFYFLNETTGWLVSHDSVYKSIDGGESWALTNTFDNYYLQNIVVNNNYCYLFGQDSSFNEIILRSAVDTMSWIETQIDTVFSSIILDVEFSKKVGYASSLNTIYRSENEGLLWEKLPVFTGVSIGGGGYFSKIQLLNEDTLIARKAVENILVEYGFMATTDAGKTWQDYPHPKWGLYDQDFFFTSLKTGWTANHQAVVKTTNYGAKWDTLLIVNDIIQKFSAIDSLTSWAIGDSTLYFTDDGWKSYKATNSIITKLENDKAYAQSYHLYQNYPNPFNPKTTIRFALGKREHVIIEIFNSIGQKLKYKFDKELNVGNHKVIFNGNHLPSGIYFYKLTAGNFIAINKMLIIK